MKYFLASIMLFVVVSADEIEVEPAHVDAALSEDDQCALGATSCAFEALQTKVVKGVADVEYPHDEAVVSVPEMKVISDVAPHEEDDDSAPEIRALAHVVEWYNEVLANASENWATDAIVGSQEVFDTYSLEPSVTSPEIDPCRSGMLALIREEAPECFDACPQMCEPIAEAIMIFTGGDVAGCFRAICRHKESFYCPLLDENRPKCEPLKKMIPVVPHTIPAIQELCQKYE